MRVLVVDDSQTTRRLLGMALKQLGVTDVIEAESADAALALLQKTSDVEMILTDWHMPGMSGLEFLKILRASPKFKGVPIIMSTSETAGENVVAALKAGATNYLIKPFNKEQVGEKVGPIIRANLAEAAMAANHSVPKAVSQTGFLRENELGDVVQFFMGTRKTGTCELDYSNCTAAIYIQDGRITGARYQLQKGEPAFYTCFCVTPQRYRFCEGAFDLPDGCAILTPSTALLIEAVSRRDTTKAARTAL